jgi:hypothetical protein
VALLRTLGEENVGVYTSSSKMSFESIQEIVDVHAISSSDGRCVTCETKGPCGPRSDALEELAGAISCRAGVWAPPDRSS